MKSKIGSVLFYSTFLLVMIYLVASRLSLLSAVRYNINNDLWKGPESSSITLPGVDIDLHPTLFDADIAVTCLYLIDTVYSGTTPNPEDIQIEAQFFNRRKIITGAVYKYQDIYWLVFRGTINLYDVLTDAHTSQSAWSLSAPSDAHPSPMVHTGFYTSYLELREQIVEWVGRVPSDAKVIIAGHSLGAGIALLCACEEAFFKISTTVLYSFACPRVGNPDFVGILHKNIPNCFRVSNTDDIVVSTPLPITIRPFHPHSPYLYEHYGEPVLFNLNRYSYYRNHSIYTYSDALLLF